MYCNFKRLNVGCAHENFKPHMLELLVIKSSVIFVLNNRSVVLAVSTLSISFFWSLKNLNISASDSQIKYTTSGNKGKQSSGPSGGAPTTIYTPYWRSDMWIKFMRVQN